MDSYGYPDIPSVSGKTLRSEKLSEFVTLPQNVEEATKDGLNICGPEGAQAKVDALLAKYGPNCKVLDKGAWQRSRHVDCGTGTFISYPLALP